MPSHGLTSISHYQLEGVVVRGGFFFHSQKVRIFITFTFATSSYFSPTYCRVSRFEAFRIFILGFFVLYFFIQSFWRAPYRPGYFHFFVAIRRAARRYVEAESWQDKWSKFLRSCGKYEEKNR